MIIPHDPDEILTIVDDEDKSIGQDTRKNAHEKGLLHREVGVILINHNKEVLLQKRMDFNVWDTSAAGHFPYNEEYEEAAVRELEEELGIKVKKEEIKELGKERISSSRITNERFLKLFLVKKDIKINEFNIDQEEIKEIKFFNFDEAKEIIKTNKDIATQTIKLVLKKYIIEKLN
jgi:isopentenyl-diphosphate Delta-isomerase